MRQLSLPDAEDNLQARQLDAVKRKIAAVKRKDHDKSDPVKSLRRDKTDQQFLIYADRVWSGEFQSRAAAMLMHHLVYVFRENPITLVNRHGLSWMAKASIDWARYLQMSEGAVSRLLRQLEKTGYIDRKILKCGRTPVNHIRPNWPKVVAVYSRSAGYDHTEDELRNDEFGNPLLAWLQMGIGMDAVGDLVDMTNDLYDRLAAHGTPSSSRLDILAEFVRHACSINDLPDSVLNTRRKPLTADYRGRYESAENLVKKKKTRLHFSRNSDLNKLSRSMTFTNCSVLNIKDTKINGHIAPYVAPQASLRACRDAGLHSARKLREAPVTGAPPIKKRPPRRLRLRPGGLFSLLHSGDVTGLIRKLRPDIPVELADVHRVRALPQAVTRLRAALYEAQKDTRDYRPDLEKSFLSYNDPEEVKASGKWFNPIAKEWVMNNRPVKLTMPCFNAQTLRLLGDNQRWVYRYTPELNKLVFEEDRVETLFQELVVELDNQSNPLVNPLRELRVSSSLVPRELQCKKKVMHRENPYDEYNEKLEHELAKFILVERKEPQYESVE